MRQDTIESDQPGGGRTNFANIFEKEEIVPVGNEERRLGKTNLTMFKPISQKYPQGIAARLSTKAELSRECSVGVRIIAETKVGMGRPKLGLGCSRQLVCRLLCYTRDRRVGGPTGSLVL